MDGVDLADLLKRYGVYSLGPFAGTVDDETGVFGDLVVEAAGGFVGFVGVPVETGGAGVFGLLVNAFNQGFAYSFSAGWLGGE